MQREGKGNTNSEPAPDCGFIIFLFFVSLFYKNIFSSWEFTEIYPGRPAAGRPGPGRPAARRQGLICKKKEETKLQPGPWEPAAGSQAAGLSGRPAGGGLNFFYNLALFAK